MPKSSVWEQAKAQASAYAKRMAQPMTRGLTRRPTLVEEERAEALGGIPGGFQGAGSMTEQVMKPAKEKFKKLSKQERAFLAATPTRDRTRVHEVITRARGAKKY